MEVIYSVGSHFAGGGSLGNVAYHAVSAINKKNYLKRVICLTKINSNIPNNKIKDFKVLFYGLGYPLKGIQRYLIPRFNPYIILDYLYDLFASRFVTKCDIFHGWKSHALISGRVAKKYGAIVISESGSAHPLAQKKIIEDEEKIWNKTFPNFSKGQLKRVLIELDESDYVFVQSDFSYKTYLEYGFPEKKLVKMPLGADLSHLNSLKINRNNKKFRLLFLGSLIYRKGLQYLLKAWEELQLENAELIVCGNSWSESESIIKDYRKNKSIKFTGFVKPDEYYKKSDVFVCPSIEDGFALTVIEAMAYELPVIVSENTGAADLVDKHSGFIIPIRDVGALKEKILYFYNNPEITKKMGKNARKIAMQNTWEKYGRNVVKKYEEILDEKRKRG